MPPLVGQGVVSVKKGRHRRFEEARSLKRSVATRQQAVPRVRRRARRQACVVVPGHGGRLRRDPRHGAEGLLVRRRRSPGRVDGEFISVRRSAAPSEWAGGPVGWDSAGRHGGALHPARGPAVPRADTLDDHAAALVEPLATPCTRSAWRATSPGVSSPFSGPGPSGCSPSRCCARTVRGRSSAPTRIRQTPAGRGPRRRRDDRRAHA